MHRIFLFVLAIALLAGCPALAAVKVNPLFSDNAVLQRQKPITIWGTADPGEQIKVSFADQVKWTSADKEGDWKVELKSMEAGGPYDLIVKGKNEVVAHNLFTGEVWLCSGQSNMGVPTSYAHGSKDDIANSSNPQIHLFKEQDQLSQTTPMTKMGGSWTLADPKTVRDFSAVAYYFGRKVQGGVKMPVGLIWAAFAGTPIKVWMSSEALDAAHDTSQVILPPNYLAVKEAFDQAVAKWQDDLAEARAKGVEEPAKPVLPSNFYAVSSAFNGMINPMIPFALRGVVWYQGESDTDYPARWHKMFSCMVDDWRSRWHDPTLPFLYVQLPSYDKRSEKPTESLWAELREGQLLARRVPYAYMACTIDVERDELVDMHPREKRQVGERLGTMALALVYKQPVPYSGPLYDSMEVVNGNRVKLNFRYAESGLVAKDGPLRGFEIAGVDQKFVEAQARIAGSSVLVWSEKVPAPVAVRYGWASNPNVNLFNKENFPAAPFRTDRWVHKWGKKKNV